MSRSVFAARRGLRTEHSMLRAPTRTATVRTGSDLFEVELRRPRTHTRHARTRPHVRTACAHHRARPTQAHSHAPRRERSAFQPSAQQSGWVTSGACGTCGTPTNATRQLCGPGKHNRMRGSGGGWQTNARSGRLHVLARDANGFNLTSAGHMRSPAADDGTPSSRNMWALTIESTSMLR